MIIKNLIPKVCSVVSIYFYLYGIFKSIEYSKIINGVKPSDVSSIYGTGIGKLNQGENSMREESSDQEEASENLKDTKFNKRNKEASKIKSFNEKEDKFKMRFNSKSSIKKENENEKKSTQIKNTQPPYENLIYIVFDGLRFDWTIPSTQTESKSSFQSNVTSNTDSTNNIKSTTATQSKFSKHYLSDLMPNLYAIPNKFHSLSISAIPTATSVRIAGLLTGSPSNYLEGLKTFINDKLQIDNLVTQLYKKYKHKISFFGDRTWTDFCPILSTCPHFTIDPYAKTNLVENEIKAMSEFIKRINQDKAVLGHFISLDAFGHLHGTHHIEMRNSLKRFDKFIKQVYDKMDDNTLLVLTSDHGITDEGEHGGVSKPEMSSFISLISKRGIKLKTVSDQIKKTRQSYLNPRYDSDDSRMVHQDDILPTVCYLMDLCLPTNSYGNVIYEVVDDFEYLEWFCDKKRELLNHDVSGDDVKRDKNSLEILDGEKENLYDENKNKKNIIKTKSCIDETVVKELLNKKTNKINKHDENNKLHKNHENEKTQNEKLLNLIKKHYKLTSQIYNKYSGIRSSFLITSFILLTITTILIYKDIKSISKASYLLLILSIIMVSHSIRFLKNEKLVWTGFFLFYNMSWYNFIVMMMVYFQDNKFIFFFCLFVLYIKSCLDEKIDLSLLRRCFEKIKWYCRSLIKCLGGYRCENEECRDLSIAKYKENKTKCVEKRYVSEDCCKENERVNEIKSGEKRYVSEDSSKENEGLCTEGCEDNAYKYKCSYRKELRNVNQDIKEKLRNVDKDTSKEIKEPKEECKILLNENKENITRIHKYKNNKNYINLKCSTKLDYLTYLLIRKYNSFSELFESFNNFVLVFFKNCFTKIYKNKNLVFIINKVLVFSLIMIRKIKKNKFMEVLMNKLPSIKKLGAPLNKNNITEWKVETHIYIILSIIKYLFPSFINNRNFIALHPSMLTLSLLTFNPKLNILYLIVPYLTSGGEGVMGKKVSCGEYIDCKENICEKEFVNDVDIKCNNKIVQMERSFSQYNCRTPTQSTASLQSSTTQFKMQSFTQTTMRSYDDPSPYINFIYPLLNILSGTKNIEKLDYSIPYVFTDTPSPIISGIPAIFYFIYPRTLIKKQTQCSTYFLISLFSLILVFCVTLWEFDSMMFHFYFGGRCFFICLFFVIDNLILNL